MRGGANGNGEPALNGVGVLARFEFRDGYDEEIERFFRDGRAIVESSQPATTAWFAFRLGPTTYGAFAWFAADADRQALLAAGGPRSARKNTDLFLAPPSFDLVDVVFDRRSPH